VRGQGEKKKTSAERTRISKTPLEKVDSKITPNNLKPSECLAKKKTD
jgi:hypothetical protein